MKFIKHIIDTTQIKEYQQDVNCGGLMIIKCIKISIFLFPAVIFFIFLCIKMFLPFTYETIIEEDSIVEYLQVIFYFISSILSLLISIRFMKNKMPLQGILYAVLFIVLLFVSFEEMSWGQRIFNIETPVFFLRHNYQYEISLHNMLATSKLHNIYILVGVYGSFAWIFVWLFLSKAQTNLRHVANFVVPDWFLIFYYFLPFLIYIILEYINRPHSWTFTMWRDQEVAELLLSLGFLFFTTINYTKLRRICLSNAYGKHKQEMLFPSLRMIEQNRKPTADQIETWLGKSVYSYWTRIIALIDQLYPGVFTAEWFFGGKKDGWCLRYKKGKLFCSLIPEKKRVLLMMMFNAEENAMMEKMHNQFLPQTVKSFEEATKYNNTKQLCLEIDSEKIFEDIKKLLAIKRKPNQSKK